jgi:hypothetical protein
LLRLHCPTAGVSLRVRFIGGDGWGFSKLSAPRLAGARARSRWPSKHPFWCCDCRWNTDPSVEIRPDTPPTTYRRLLPRCFPRPSRHDRSARLSL